MSDEIFWDKKNPLEEAFFAAENERLRQRLLAANEEKSQREALSAASGISDDAALNRLASLNIRSDTLAALAVAPSCWWRGLTAASTTASGMPCWPGQRQQASAGRVSRINCLKAG